VPSAEAVTVLVYAWAILFVGLWLWAFVDADGQTWQRAGYRKALWLWAMFAPGFLIAPIAVVVYVTRVRVRVRAAEIEAAVHREQALRRAATRGRAHDAQQS
jgi:NADH:ubiquinone oxidoreductase subunit 6 (subunit J)